MGASPLPEFGRGGFCENMRVRRWVRVGFLGCGARAALGPRLVPLGTGWAGYVALMSGDWLEEDTDGAGEADVCCMEMKWGEAVPGGDSGDKDSRGARVRSTATAYRCGRAHEPADPRHKMAASLDDCSTTMPKRTRADGEDKVMVTIPVVGSLCGML